MPKESFTESLQYKFENIISWSPLVRDNFLSLLSFFIVIITAIFITLIDIQNSNGTNMDFLKSTWQIFMRVKNSA
jgi:hypothetical protein